MSVTATSLIGQLVAERPGLSRIFEKLGIDYCCGGKRTLEQACRAKKLELPTVVALLDALEAEPAAGPVDVSAMTFAELADHIVQRHHAYLRRELPRLAPLIEKIAFKHADKNPRLPQLPIVFAAFAAEMQSHMETEERELFPLIRQIEGAAAATSTTQNLNGLAQRIETMEAEHQHAGDDIATMRQITDDFSTPPAACNTYRAVMHALAELERDLHQHVHKENNILFPRAVAAAASPDACGVAQS